MGQRADSEVCLHISAERGCPSDGSDLSGWVQYLLCGWFINISLWSHQGQQSLPREGSLWSEAMKVRPVRRLHSNTHTHTRTHTHTHTRTHTHICTHTHAHTVYCKCAAHHRQITLIRRTGALTLETSNQCEFASKARRGSDITEEHASTWSLDLKTTLSSYV